ncbi:MAG: family 20 glycosylhydrolase [Ginsengibacter sp.]
MKLPLLRLLFLCLLTSDQVFSQGVHIIPEPFSIVEKTGSFQFNSKTKIVIDKNNEGSIKIFTAFAKQFKIASGIELKTGGEITAPGAVNTIAIEIKQAPEIKNKEGYILDITSDEIKISAVDLPGLFYAFESLKQMLPPQFYGTGNLTTQWNVSCAYIVDYPQFGYRGMMLDVSRHFFPASFIKHYLDILSHYKINTFHWHLTDSHGWRLQIKQYPKLTSVGAWRADRTGIPMTIAEATQPGEPATYGGFYTQLEIKEIVQYAKDRFISIIPEIEMPGHCTAALVAYPEFNDLNNKTPLLRPCGYPGDLKHNFCIGYDSTYIFLQNILKEVMELFPSSYIHIGGDEVRGEPWLNCPRCQKLMAEKNFTTAKELQAYFTRRIDTFITAHNKKIIGWEEILWAHVSHQSASMAWHDNEGAVSAVKKDYDVVMTPYRYTYLDFYQSAPRLEKFITYAPLFLDTVYSFNPLPAGLNAAETKHILGGQACLWTENVETPARVEYMTLPRLFALAEVLWTPAHNKNYSKFIHKTEDEFRRLDVQRVTYATSLYNVSILPVFNPTDRTITVALHDQAAGKYAVHYTTNGLQPTSGSAVYHTPLVIANSLRLKTALIYKNKIRGKINEDDFVVHKAIGSQISMLPAAEDGNALSRLVDGIHGTVEPYDHRWVSFHDSVVIITIDLQKITAFHSINFSCMEDQVGNIFLPAEIVLATSTDGETYKNIQVIKNKKIPAELLRHTVNYKKNNLNVNARYLKVTLKNADLFKNDPDKNLLLLDEIAVQ